MFEASGAPAALGGVLRATARGGTVVQVGNLPGTAVPAVLGDLVTREITWIGAYRFVEEISDALQAMCDGLDVSPLITHRFDLDRAAEALAVAADRTSGSSKVMLRLGPGRDRPMSSPGSVVTLGETMALLGTPGVRPALQRLVAAARSRRGGVQRGDRPGPARRAVHLDQPGRRRRAGHVRHPGDPGRGRAGAGPAGSGGADRADVQGAPRRAALAGPLLPQRQRGLPAVGGRPRRARDRRRDQRGAGAAPDRHHARARPRPAGRGRARGPARAGGGGAGLLRRQPPGDALVGRGGRPGTGPAGRGGRPGVRRAGGGGAGARPGEPGRAGERRRRRGSWPGRWPSWARPPWWSSSARSVRWPCPATRPSTPRPGRSPWSTRSARATPSSRAT